MNNIQLLGECVEKTEKNKSVIETLIAFRDFNFSCCGSELSCNWIETIEFFSESWQQLHKNYGVRIPNKVHIVQAHVATYIQRTGKSLGRVSDQIVESTHMH